MENNFNSLTAGQAFPSVTIAALAVKGDPGFVVVTKEGQWSWAPNLESARAVAGTDCAVYAAEVCGEYFKALAVEETIVKGKIVPKGK